MPPGEKCSEIKIWDVFFFTHVSPHFFFFFFLTVEKTKHARTNATEKAPHSDARMGSLSVSATWLAKV